MGCNMCVVRRPEERFKVMYQQKGRSNSLQPIERHANEKGKGRRRSYLPLDKQLRSQEPLQQSESNIKSHRRKGVMASAGNGTKSTSISTFAGVSRLRESVDSATQTDVSFRQLPPTPSLPHLMEAYQIEDFCMFVDSDDYLDVSRHDVDRAEELEYEEVALYKSHQEEKLGLTVCYMTDDEDQQGIYVGEVNPNSLAAKNGRIREGDRILQINGVDIGSREEAVAMLSREDSGNFSLLLARPDMEEDQFADGISTEHLSPYFQLQHRGGELDDGEEDDDEEGNRAEPPVPLPPLLQLTPLLSNSQDLDSGLGRTDDSTRYDESSEHDLLGGTSSACNTDVTNTPRSARKFCLGHSPRLSPRPSPVVGSSPKMSPSPVHPREDTPPQSPHQQELQLTTNSFTALDGTEEQSTQNHVHQKLQLYKSPVNLIATMAGLTEDECQRYQELLEIRYHCETRPRTRDGEVENEKEKVPPSAMDLNCNLSMSEREMALIEEELRHLEFKWRNILRAQKMQQLRERYLKAWMMEEETAEPGVCDNNDISNDDPHRNELAAINELPEHSNNGKDSTSAYGSGESCRSTPMVSTVWIPPLPEDETPASPPHHWGRRHSNLGCGSQNGDLVNTSPSKFRLLSREVESPSRRGMAEGTHGTRTGLQGGSAESSPFLAQRRQRPFERYHSCMALPSDGMLEPLDRRLAEDRATGSVPASPRSISSAPCGLEHQHTASRLRLALPLALEHSSATATAQRMEWKVKIRSDGTRYVAKRPVRDRLLKARAMQIREERGGTTTDDDAAASEMKLGRYWSKEERKQQLLRAREYRRRREFMMQSRLDYLKGDSRDALSSASGNVELMAPGHNDSIKSLSQKKISKKRNRRILDNWNTIQELLAHGSHSPDGKKIFNPLLSVTTV
ncbi:PDZ domain-containing protein 4-like isoform X3 [Corythoichthys intestinalis]|uniref:PDZ domain-containing protein 4-like isoform X3 n=1 Tax=Corythoichthys intestinalis TaxID=161448 RepID=UPI0025A58B5A|nr:PDZ domain-containing protein 4-like isoform X3 [Corythoichthys intestinalis]